MNALPKPEHTTGELTTAQQQLLLVWKEEWLYGSRPNVIKGLAEEGSRELALAWIEWLYEVDDLRGVTTGFVVALRAVTPRPQKAPQASPEPAEPLSMGEDQAQGLKDVQGDLDAIEKENLERMLELHGSVKAAAKAMDLSHGTLYRRMAKYGIPTPTEKAAQG
jgi:DNA-binding NtrC family response regulator